MVTSTIGKRHSNPLIRGVAGQMDSSGLIIPPTPLAVLIGIPTRRNERVKMGFLGYIPIATAVRANPWLLYYGQQSTRVCQELRAEGTRQRGRARPPGRSSKPTKISATKPQSGGPWLGGVTTRPRSTVIGGIRASRRTRAYEENIQQNWGGYGAYGAFLRNH